MINKDRIIPIMAVDRLSLIGETLTLIGTSYTAVAAEDVEGNFKITGSGAAGNKLCNQAAKTIDFATGVTGATVYFIPGFGFEGFKIAGVAVTATGTVDADCSSLYKAVLSSGAVTVTAVTPAVPA